jgi:sodium transport system permease protein
MSRGIRVVFFKEVLENLRDRRVVFSAFFFGVLLAPMIFALTTTLASQRVVRSQEQLLKLPVVGAQYAPNLIRFLQENGVEIQEIKADVDESVRQVRAGQREFVLRIEQDYVDKLQAGEPAPVALVVDTANGQAAGSMDRARRLLESYGRQVAALRLLVRGISPEVIQPVDVHMLDVATPAGRSLLLLGMLTYFCFMSMLVGGFYLAIDTTAGERERGSLEPLLTLPVHRAELIIGKMLATAAFMCVSLLLTLPAFALALRFIPLEALGMSANFGFAVTAKMFLIMATFIPLGAGLMTVVASFTRSNREAQSWLSLVYIVPLAPILFAVVNGTKATPALVAIPSLGQHLIATDLMRGDPIPALNVAICAASSLLVGALLVWLAVRLYGREAILGNT